MLLHDDWCREMKPRSKEQTFLDLLLKVTEVAVIDDLEFQYEEEKQLNPPSCRTTNLYFSDGIRVIKCIYFLFGLLI